MASEVPGWQQGLAYSLVGYMIQNISQGIGKGKSSAELVPYCNTGRPKGVQEPVKIFIRPDEIKLSLRQTGLVALGIMNPYDLWMGMVYKMSKVLMGGGRCTWARRDQLEQGRNGFEHRVTLYRGRRELASLEWGGSAQRGWCLLHIHGALCKLLRPKDYRSLYCLAKRLEALGDNMVRLGAIDIAGDDFHGQLGIHPSQVRRAHYRNDRAFMPGHLVKGQAPRFHKWYETPEGSTLYLGGQRSSIRHRVYEKGKEQKDQLHLSWHRWEVMYRRTDKASLQLELLLPSRWASAWLGSCKWLQRKFKETGAQFVNKTEKARREAQEKAARTVVQLEKQYGGVISHLVRILGAEELLALLERLSLDSDLSDLTSEDSEEIIKLISELKHHPGAPGHQRHARPGRRGSP